MGPAQIGVTTNTLTYGGVIIGTIATNTNGLTFSLTTNATAGALTALLRQLTFATTNGDTNLRIIEADLNYQGNAASAQRALTLDRPPVASAINIWAAANVPVPSPSAKC